jgi:hypothetical protein
MAKVPQNIVSKMETFGRMEFYWEDSSIDRSRIWDDFATVVYPMAEADPEGFISHLAEAVVPVGGWAAYGAERTLFNLSSPVNKESPAYHAILTASLNFLRENGVPNLMLSGYEWEYWITQN